MYGPFITDLEREYVMDAMRDSGWYGNTKWHYAETFRKEFAQYHDRAYGITTPNCTSALHLLLMGLGIGPGDEVIVPDCTWIATAAPICYVGAQPIFCDIETLNWCIDPKSICENITDKTKAIIMVDLYGNMPFVETIQILCKERNIHLIEDVAEGLGSMYKGVRAGKFGIGSVFSFHRTKTLTTGEGGILLLDDDRLYEKCMILRDHGKDPNNMYCNIQIGYKYMPSNLWSALGLAQLRRLPELVELKRQQFQWYQEELKNVPDIQLNTEHKDMYNSYWGTTIVFGHSYNIYTEKIIRELAKLKIPTRPFFYPLSSSAAFNPCGYPVRDIHQVTNPNSYDISDRGISLPGSAKVNQEDIQFICDGIKMVLKEHQLRITQ